MPAPRRRVKGQLSPSQLLRRLPRGCLRARVRSLGLGYALRLGLLARVRLLPPARARAPPSPYTLRPQLHPQLGRKLSPHCSAPTSATLLCLTLTPTPNPTLALTLGPHTLAPNLTLNPTTDVEFCKEQRPLLPPETSNRDREKLLGVLMP